MPAREAARAAPARALKAGDEETALARLRSPTAGLVLFALGALLVGLPPIEGLPLAGYVAIACLLVGTLLLMPWLAARVLARLPMPSQFAPALALAQLRGAPGQVAVSLASIVAAVSLMVSMAIMVTSFRTSLDAWLARVLPAELYFRTPASDSAFLAPSDRARIESLPGVARVEFMREEQLLLDAARPRVVLLARPLVERDAATRLPLVEPPRRAAAGSATAGVGQRGDGRPVRLPARAGGDAADRRPRGAVLRRRRVARLRPPAGRRADRGGDLGRA